MSREKWISVRVTEEENRAIEEKMKKHGILNRGAYIRKMAIDGYCLSLEVKELQKLATLLGRYGNNLNQVAKRAKDFRRYLPAGYQRTERAACRNAESDEANPHENLRIWLRKGTGKPCRYITLNCAAVRYAILQNKKKHRGLIHE